MNKFITTKNIKFLLWISLAVLGSTHQRSFATCTYWSGAMSPQLVVVPPLSITRDMPIGTVLARVSGTMNSYQMKCPIGPSSAISRMPRPIGRLSSMPVIGSDGQPIPGLGVRLGGELWVATSTGKCGPVSFMHQNRRVITANTVLSCDNSFADNPVSPFYSFQYGSIILTFIKTSDELSSAVLGTDDVFTTQIDSTAPQIYRIAGGSSVSVNACSFTVPPSVSLGAMSSANLQRGQSGAVAPFQLGINCDANARVKLRFAPIGGSTVVSGNAGTMTNGDTSATAAQGVNVQLLDDQGRPIVLARDIDYGIQPATTTFSFGARMVPSGTSVRQGNVRAMTTVTATFE